MLKTCFPERLKQLRRDAGMLQADLAEHFKVSKSAVSGWEVQSVQVRGVGLGSGQKPAQL